MDLTESIEPRSDQWNADDLIAGPVTVTIREVVKGAAEQPFDFALVESDRCYRPSKTSRRVIVAAWGPDAAVYAGRQLTLYREPSITFGGKVVGGIRVSAMSHIDGPVTVQAQTTRGKRETFTVQPIEARPTTEGGDPVHTPGESPASDHPAAQQSESAASQAPLWRAVEEQMDALTSHQRARLAKVCKELDIRATRDGLIEAWGEGARDLVGMCESVEARVET